MNSLEQVLLYFVLTCAIGGSLSMCATIVFHRYPRTVINFQGRAVPVGYGIYLVAWALAPTLFAISRWPAITLGFLAPVISLALLGYVDDAYGVHGKGGIKGHFRSFFVDHKFTTGLAKLLGGAIASVVGAKLLRPDESSLVIVLVNGSIIALFANVINLLDLRPGRAIFSFLVLWVCECVLSRRVDFILLSAPAGLASLILGRRDSRGDWIMGDVGSNTLGVILGTGVVLVAARWEKLLVLTVLIAAHLFAEFYSISTAINSNRFLSAIDRRLGIR